MKLFASCAMATGILILSTAAHAQRGPYVVEGPAVAATDNDEPYVVTAPREIAPRYAPAPIYERELLPPRAIFNIARDSGFSPLGRPRQRGMFYVVAAIGPDGDDGRLVIDARSGRIRRFVPAYRMGRFDDETALAYGPSGPQPMVDGRPPRPPARVPHVASLPPSVPLPKTAPAHNEATSAHKAAHAVGGPAKPVAATPAPAPAQRSASTQATTVGVAKSAEQPSPAPAVVEQKPSAPAILPTQEMPAVLGLD